MDLVRVLSEASNEDLEPLVQLLTEPITAGLVGEEKYQRYFPNHSRYTEEIAYHFRRFGGNTLVNIPRGEGPAYEEIVQDVAGKLGVAYEYDEPVEKTEGKIFREIVRRALESDEVSPDEKKALRAALGSDEKKDIESLVESFKKMAPRNRIVFFGPGWGPIIGPLAPFPWLVLANIAGIPGPAYRVTIPGVCVVACLRLKIQCREDFGGNE